MGQSRPLFRLFSSRTRGGRMEGTDVSELLETNSKIKSPKKALDKKRAIQNCSTQKLHFPKFVLRLKTNSKIIIFQSLSIVGKWRTASRALLRGWGEVTASTLLTASRTFKQSGNETYVEAINIKTKKSAACFTVQKFMKDNSRGWGRN